MINFKWTVAKSRKNFIKHGVSFEEAKTVFFDPYARLIEDPEHSGLEDRYILLGLSEKTRVLIVCHCYRDDDATIRIYSARKATKTEIKAYKEHLP